MKFKLALLLTAVIFGCNAVTDFEMPTDTGESDTDTDTDTDSDTDTDTDSDVTYSLDANLADPVTVTLQEDGNAVISLVFAAALPEADGGDSELEAMLGDTIALNVINDDTSISFNLAQGTLVDDTPDSSGEYMVVLSADRMTLDITFTNDFNGSVLSTAGDYSALISVTANEQSFEVAEFTRNIEVTE